MTVSGWLQLKKQLNMAIRKVNLKLTESDCLFVHFVLRQYAAQTPGLDSYDRQEIREIANKFK
jgi:hypothetical protein